MRSESSGVARALLAQYGCIACHAIDKKVVGPSFRDVQAKCAPLAGAEKPLLTKVRNGGGGVWGAIPMPPNVAVPNSDLQVLVHWILTSPDVKK